ncbi:ATPase [Planomonospora parontospora subsp. parontospora]|uniref:ATPase n=2 Tax=Planomonospora parontospora TaxID=58119 RepID=A0AA37BJA0_9ACTN|nr:ArsA-related P-loop ATPase [Planomonospora parontospora]GGK80439.1 ATPase [Planomonospora parontospora]GII11335.1 ATPase [Planomonospora parontospora subsp. parontospora]
MKARDTDWDGVRLHVVTGKGGTGKTTVAAALALALAAGGRKVLLVEVEGRQGIAQIFDLPPLPYEERKIAVAPGGGDVHALAVDPEEAMLDYLEMFYGMRRAGRALSKLGIVDFATTIAPGFRDVLVTGKTTEAVRRRGKEGRRVYDAVVLDAPPTGRIVRFLNVTNEVAGLARMGPIKNHADLVNGVVASPETAVHFVTLLEEMPVQETLDGLAELRAAGLPPGGVFTNMVRTSLLPAEAVEAAAAGRFDPDELALGLKAAGLADGADAAAVASALTEEIVEHARRTELERQERASLDAAGRPRYELPLLPDGVDLAGLYELAESIRTQGAA